MVIPLALSLAFPTVLNELNPIISLIASSGSISSWSELILPMRSQAEMGREGLLGSNE